MKRLLLPLLAALALPTAVNAESHWLIIRVTSYGDGNAFEKIEMESAEACDKEGRRWMDSPTDKITNLNKGKYFHCVIGK